MGRLTKQGIDYFSLDVQFDDKVELYIIEKESLGLAVMITLFQIIYQNEGYYTYNGKDLFLLIKKRINANINDINDCINTMLDRGILNKELYEKYKILTSSGIQKRYFDAAKRKKVVRIINDFLLIDVNVYENTINVNINAKDVGRNATKEKVKVKEKVKENIKEKEETKKQLEIAKKIIEYLNKKTVKNFRQIESNYKQILARIKEGYLEKQFKFIIDNKLKDKYFQENPKYYNPETLFRKSNIEKYLNETFPDVKDFAYYNKQGESEEDYAPPDFLKAKMKRMKEKFANSLPEVKENIE